MLPPPDAHFGHKAASRQNLVMFAQTSAAFVSGEAGRHEKRGSVPPAAGLAVTMRKRHSGDYAPIVSRIGPLLVRPKMMKV